MCIYWNIYIYILEWKFNNLIHVLSKKKIISAPRLKKKDDVYKTSLLSFPLFLVTHRDTTNRILNIIKNNNNNGGWNKTMKTYTATPASPLPLFPSYLLVSCTITNNPLFKTYRRDFCFVLFRKRGGGGRERERESTMQF